MHAYFTLLICFAQLCCSALGTRWNLPFKCGSTLFSNVMKRRTADNLTSSRVGSLLDTISTARHHVHLTPAGSWVARMLPSAIASRTMNNTVSDTLPLAGNNNLSLGGRAVRSPAVRGAIVTLTAAAGAARVAASTHQLTYLQSMAAGAVSRSIAQTIMHPANTYKTLLQLRRSKKLPSFKLRNIPFRRLMRGADAQFVLSLPHGAFQFFVVDQVKGQLAKVVPRKLDFLSDFSSSAISTIICSIVSTPQMVLTDRLMAGLYPSFPAAVRTIASTEGLRGFYAGWWPALAQKIPSYGLTWMFFQQLKRSYEGLKHSNQLLQAGHHTTTNTGISTVGTTVPTQLSGLESFLLGALAAAGGVAVMNPMDTIKTRLVTQAVGLSSSSAAANAYLYKGVADCFWRMLREEGPRSFYRSLPPRLLSVVPMIAIQFAVYESMKGRFLAQRRAH